MTHLNILVKGKVQGVFYRASANKMANELGLKGFVRNEPNGEVYIEVEGEKDILDKFVNWCKQGPTHAIVDSVKIEESELKNFSEFKTKY